MNRYPPGEAFLKWKMTGFAPDKKPGGVSMLPVEKNCLICNAEFFSPAGRHAKYCLKHTVSDSVVANVHSIQGRGMVRYLVRARDEFTCQDCGLVRTQAQVDARNKNKHASFKSLDVHHLNGQCGKNSKGYDKVKDMAGLITVCHKCHFRRHDFSKKRKTKI